MSKYTNNIIKINEESLSDSDNSTDSNNLSEELNSISTVSKTNILNITIIYNQLYSLFSNNTESKIIVEIISFKISGTNAWINVKSDEFQILCVFWKITLDKNYNAYKLIKPGDKFTLNGKFNIMKKNLSIYFNVQFMEKFGKGDYLDIYDGYRLKIKEIKMKIEKKQLNHFPYTIGIVTSLEGAAIQDIIQILKLDKFVGNIIIKNSIVQGSQCSKSLINSIEWFESNYLSSNIENSNKIDLLMITRGGGSWEDLVGFSDWDLLIKLSTVNFITLSAVGHQIDNQLTDEICTYKFATPSAGAKFIAETQQKYILYLNKCIFTLRQILNKFTEYKNKFNFTIMKNYSNIIKKYEIKDTKLKLKKYSNKLQSILSSYMNLKNIFYNKLSNLKPTIIRKNEIISINDFINVETDIEVKPKKIEIYLVDGMILLSYKIIKYEKFN